MRRMLWSSCYSFTDYFVSTYFKMFTCTIQLYYWFLGIVPSVGRQEEFPLNYAASPFKTNTVTFYTPLVCSQQRIHIMFCFVQFPLERKGFKSVLGQVEREEPDSWDILFGRAPHFWFQRDFVRMCVFAKAKQNKILPQPSSMQSSRNRKGSTRGKIK